MEENWKARSLSDRIAKRVMRWVRLYRAPLMGGLIFGFAAYMFMITNKLVNWDDLDALFSTGPGIGNGRWGLDLFRWIFPPCSMPWLIGLIAIVLLSITSCMVVRVCSIRNKVLQFLLAGAIVSFPSEFGLMGYMFAVHYYAFAFLLSVGVVILYRGGSFPN